VERRKTFHEFKVGDLVQLRIDNCDGGLGIVVEDLDCINDECYYLVYLMRENKKIPVFPYEIELVQRD